jgi:hypothetical protein
MRRPFGSLAPARGRGLRPPSRSGWAGKLPCVPFVSLPALADPRIPFPEGLPPSLATSLPYPSLGGPPFLPSLPPWRPSPSPWGPCLGLPPGSPLAGPRGSWGAPPSGPRQLGGPKSGASRADRPGSGAGRDAGAPWACAQDGCHRPSGQASGSACGALGGGSRGRVRVVWAYLRSVWEYMV